MNTGIFREITACRICGNTNLVEILNLGDQALTGVFPKSANESVPVGPLTLVKCHGDVSKSCGLVQLKHTYNATMMYGENYGYRSGLNPSMVQHLQRKVASILKTIELSSNDLVIDVGSNDGTTLGFYPDDFTNLVGVDPTAAKFRQYYKPHVKVVADFFTGDAVKAIYGLKRAKVVSSFSMFYDLDKPVDFAQQVCKVLEPGGIWVCEQSYMPTMLRLNSYDTVCHEHLEYYGLRQIKWITDLVGFKIEEIEFNDVNGGSFSFVARKMEAGAELEPTCPAVIEAFHQESLLELDFLPPFAAFAERVKTQRDQLLAFLNECRKAGKRVAGLGASTKGNVILQYCNIKEDLLAAVGEVNPDKYGSYTPGTMIPIKPESEIVSGDFDYLIVLPWHFRAFFDSLENFAGENLVYPLPTLEIVRR